MVSVVIAICNFSGIDALSLLGAKETPNYPTDTGRTLSTNRTNRNIQIFQINARFLGPIKWLSLVGRARASSIILEIRIFPKRFFIKKKKTTAGSDLEHLKHFDSKCFRHPLNEYPKSLDDFWSNILSSLKEVLGLQSLPSPKSNKRQFRLLQRLRAPLLQNVLSCKWPLFRWKPL